MTARRDAFARSRRRRRTIAAAALAAVLAITCDAGRPPDVFLILADTLRADRLGAYGSDRRLTPVLDSLAAQSQVYGRAYSTSSWTSPAVASLFTSRFPSQHRVIRFGSVLAPTERTLAEVLRERGYATGGFSANGLVTAELGFAQGFDVYKVHGGYNPKPRHELDRRIVVRGRELNRAALAWIDEILRQPAPHPPLFVYLHYMEPHIPFEPEPEAVARVLGDRPAPDFEQTTDVHLRGRINSLTLEQRRDVGALYDAEVVSLDNVLAELFVALEARELLDPSLLFDELVRIPLMVRLPGASSGARLDAPVSIVDVAPAIAAAAGAPAPEAFRGRPLSSESGQTRLLLSELIRTPKWPQAGGIRHERALIEGRKKLIIDEGGAARVFDLARDPEERRPLSPETPGAKRLRASLKTLLEALAEDAADAATRPMDAEMREQLRALGYASPAGP